MKKFKMKPLVTWKEYQNGTKEMTPEEKKKCDEMNKFLYGTSEPLWNRKK